MSKNRYTPRRRPDRRAAQVPAARVPLDFAMSYRPLEPKRWPWRLGAFVFAVLFWVVFAWFVLC